MEFHNSIDWAYSDQFRAGAVNQDGQLSLSDASGTTWQGKLFSSTLIELVERRTDDGQKVETPLRLRLVGTATEQDTARLPAGHASWDQFLLSFAAAVKARDPHALTGLMARRVTVGDDKHLLPYEALRKIKWKQLEGVLTKGRDEGVTALGGRPLRSRLDPTPCNICVYAVLIDFFQDSGGYWRFAGIGFPGD